MGSPLDAWRDAVLELLRAAQVALPGGLAGAVNDAVRPLGVEFTMYLVDLEQRSLRAVPGATEPVPRSLPIDDGPAGQAFMMISPVSVPDRPRRLWMPLQDGTERLGVLEVALPDWLDPDDPELREGVTLVAMLLGHLVAAKTEYGDILLKSRRSRRLSTASELLWRTVPRLTFATERMVISAVLEPCYEAGGDAFDYAVDADLARVAVLDGVGHGLTAGLTTAVAMSAMRTARVDGQPLEGMAGAADEAIIGNFSDQRFVTAVLAEVDLATGVVRYLNAGHPPPVLLRGGKAVALLDQGRRTPLGIADPTAEVGQHELEPGDRLLCYTDGFTEARDEHGEEFGLSRLVELAECHTAAGLPVPETLRRLSHDVLDHQVGPLHDDATLLMFSWSAADSRRTLL
ncbi:PP2C family protein-serine/threonine phosphatase [Planosporangium mesophilum]|uniref:PP2C family protein-serine/threonine phosphatase n=1 Tax=Planosporangium mesophilum TaxID=689768 RepID=UPI00194E8C05|nr:PP2C family protein-serine/threonine phosphatase [Planosporangium mesophilum]